MERARILIVDDSAAIHEDFKKVLDSKVQKNTKELDQLESTLFGSDADKKLQAEAPRYDLDFASQGLEAVEMVKAALLANKPYGLIFMDVRMPPGIDGIETIRLIWEKDPTVEVVLCTAFMDYSHDDIVKQLGETDRLLFLKKPFDPVAVSQMALTLTTKWQLNREAREFLNEMQKDVSNKTELLKTSSRMVEMGQMTGGIAHELNTPLAVIQLLAEEIIVKVEEMPPDVTGVRLTAQRIGKAVTRMAGIIKGLKTLSREASRDELKEEKIEELIEETLFFCKGRFKRGEVELRSEAVPHDLRVLCRGPQVSQVLVNLLNNAYDAICERPEKWVKVEAYEQGDFAVIAVTDSGNGISPEIQNRLFQPFFTTKDPGKGTGLGLSVSQSIMEAHGGRLTIDSTSKNTRFLMTIPKASKSKP